MFTKYDKEKLSIKSYDNGSYDEKNPFNLLIIKNNKAINKNFIAINYKWIDKITSPFDQINLCNRNITKINCHFTCAVVCGTLFKKPTDCISGPLPGSNQQNLLLQTYLLYK